MATTSLPRYVVFNVPKAAENTYVYRKDDGSVVAGNDDMFSELVKIEVERSNINNKRVHLRFAQKNRYWRKNEGDDTIVAASNKPEEDTTKTGCTLFEPIQTTADKMVYLTHVQTGWHVMLNNSTLGLYVKKNSVGAPLAFLDWESLVKLPKHVAFKSDNDKYLKAVQDGNNFLQFSSDDPNDVLSGHEVYLMRDGHIRIKSDQWGLFWRWASNWIYADSDDVTANNKATLFWPVKINENTIALRSVGNNHFCKRLTDDHMESCLNAGVTTTTAETKLQVQELVTNRKIYNVDYRMEDARIYGETPYVAGTTEVSNGSNLPGTVAVTLKYTATSSYSFNRSVSLTAGVSHSITAGIPEIVGATMTISAAITTEAGWSQMTTSSVEVSATGTVVVPAMNSAVVRYEGTMGKCDVPFSYTQRDMSSTDGKLTQSEQIDGVFTGVNSYGFKFIVEKYRPLA